MLNFSNKGVALAHVTGVGHAKGSMPIIWETSLRQTPNLTNATTATQSTVSSVFVNGTLKANAYGTRRRAIVIALLFIVAFALNAPASMAQSNDIGWLDTTIRSLSTDMSNMKKLKISGFIQTQFLSASKDGMTSLAGTFPAGTHNSIGIRRGRLKINYSTGIVNWLVQLNGTEKTFQLLDAYVEVKEPWLNMFSLRGGIFKPSVDQELLYGSDQRYCNEAAMIIQKLFPTEYDCGLQLNIKHPQVPVSLTAGVLNGTTIAAENDNKKNITVRLLYDDTFMNGKFRLLAGASTYQGGVYQATSDVYNMNGGVFVLNNSQTNIGQQAARNYYAGEVTMEYKSPAGKTSLSGEFWTGDQTATASSISSPGAARPTGDAYIRSFQSIFGLLAHEIQGSNTALAVKFDYFDPNTNVSGNEIGKINSNTNAVDIAYTTLSYGVIFTPTRNLRFSLWYDMPVNETSTELTGYENARKENLLTLRMQVRF